MSGAGTGTKIGTTLAIASALGLSTMMGDPINSSAFLAALTANIGANWVSDLGPPTLARLCSRFTRPRTPDTGLDGDLWDALRQAFSRALDSMVAAWWESPDGQQAKVAGGDSLTRIEWGLGALKRRGAELCSREGFAAVLRDGDGTLLAATDAPPGPDQLRRAVLECVSVWGEPNDPLFRPAAFVGSGLASAVAFQIGVELKNNQSARIALEALFRQSVLAEARAAADARRLTREQLAAIELELDHWGERLIQQSASDTQQMLSALDERTAELREQLISSLAIVGANVRTVIEVELDRTTGVILTSVRESATEAAGARRASEESLELQRELSDLLRRDHQGIYGSEDLRPNQILPILEILQVQMAATRSQVEGSLRLLDSMQSMASMLTAQVSRVALEDQTGQSGADDDTLSRRISGVIQSPSDANSNAVVGRINFHPQSSGQSRSRAWRRPAAPLVAATLIGRTFDLAVLRGALTEPSGRFVVLHGAAGIGKTLVAQQAANDLDNYFDAGIFFEEVGRTMSTGAVGMILRRWTSHAYSQGVPPGDLTLDPVTVHQHLEGHGNLLVVLDDVQDWQSVEPLLQPLPSSARVLVTTRVSSLAQRPGCYGHSLEAIDENSSVEILQAYTTHVSHDHELLLQRLARGLAGNPLALAIAGGNLRYQHPDEWTDTIVAIEQGVVGTDHGNPPISEEEQGE